MTQTDNSNEIDIRVEGRAGRITLDRPQALNALTYPQVRAMTDALSCWRDEPAVEFVLLDGAGDRALCAGGDVRALYDERETDPCLAARFWADEYRLNAMIAEYPKPYVALMDGIVMGGGIGLSAHGSHRIVTERSRLAMPETTIGLIPDVGGSWLLARAPGRMGEYLALTGSQMGSGDSIYAGFADTNVPSSQLDRLVEALVDAGGEPLSSVVAAFAEAPAHAEHAARQAEIDRLFSGGTVESIVSILETETAVPWAMETAEILHRKSPLSLKLTLRAVRQARTFTSIREALKHEYRLTTRLFEHGEFIEGVRAQLVDKDRQPRWPSRSLEAVTPGMVESFFAPLAPEAELSF